MKHIMLIAITFFPLKAVFSQNKEVLFNPSTYVIPDEAELIRIINILGFSNPPVPTIPFRNVRIPTNSVGAIGFGGSSYVMCLGNYDSWLPESWESGRSVRCIKD